MTSLKCKIPRKDNIIQETFNVYIVYEKKIHHCEIFYERSTELVLSSVIFVLVILFLKNSPQNSLERIKRTTPSLNKSMIIRISSKKRNKRHKNL